MINLNHRCQCCRGRADFTVSFKSGNELHKILLCDGCFNKYHTSAGFLQTCLDGGTHEAFGKFKILMDKESPQDMAA